MSATAPAPQIVERLRAAGCVFAEDEAHLLAGAAADPAQLDAMVDRRVAGEPLEHVLGWAEFCGLRIAVTAGVFVPRQRTELLVEEAARMARRVAVTRPPAVVDLCCGAGAVGVAVAAAVGQVELHATDIDPVAVRCAARNVVPVGGHVHEGDLYAPLPDALRGRVDVVVANAPYVPSGQIALLPPEARDHEPLVALDGGGDGLDVHRRIIAGAPEWLAPGGCMAIEVSRQQAPVAADACARAGLTPRVTTSEELEATVVVATRPGGDTGCSGTRT